MLQKGLAKIEKATLADQADKLQDAMQLYSKGIEHLYNSLRCKCSMALLHPLILYACISSTFLFPF